MSQLYAHSKFTGEVIRADKDGILLTRIGEFPFKEGELIFKPLNGDPEIISEGRLESLYVPVKRKKKVKPNMDDLAKGYIEMGNLIKESNENDNNYIFDIK